MYRFIEHIFEVVDIKVSEKNFVFKDNNKDRRNRHIFINKQKIPFNSITGFQIRNNIVFFSTWEDNTYEFNIDSFESKELNYSQVFDIYSERFTIFRSKVKDALEIYYDNINLGLTIYFETSQIFATINHIIFKSDSILYLFSVKEQKEIWKIDFKDKFEGIGLIKILSVYQNELILLLSDGIFIGLDIETGDLLWRKDTVDENLTASEFTGFGNPNVTDVFQFGSKIYIKGGSVITELDLETRKASYLFDFDDDQTLGRFSIQRAAMYEDKLFLAGELLDKEFVKHCQIKIYNITERKIEWSHDMGFPPGRYIQTIQANEDKIFALDSRNTLHIFEKE
jgi:hypothetical protein